MGDFLGQPLEKETSIAQLVADAHGAFDCQHLLNIKMLLKALFLRRFKYFITFVHRTMLGYLLGGSGKSYI